MAKKAKQTTKRPAKPGKKAAPQAKKAAAKGARKATAKPTRAAAKPARKPTTAKAAAPAKRPAARTKAKAAPATRTTKPALTPSKPALRPKPAMAAKMAEPTPVAAAPASSNGTAKAVLHGPDDLTLDRPPYGQLSEDELRKVKTGLSKRDLEHFRQILLEKRAEILGDVEGLEHHRTAGNGEMSHMPLHPADVGSDHYEQEFNLGLMQSEKKLLREIDEALLRIQKGTYGVCFESGKPIPRARLEIKPWAKYTIEVAMEREKRGLH